MAQVPGAQAQQSFATKLEQFRSGLNEDERALLDGMLAATGPQKGGEVEGYGWVWEPGGPGWHREWVEGAGGGWPWGRGACAPGPGGGAGPRRRGRGGRTAEGTGAGAPVPSAVRASA